MLGETISHYRISELLGEGGMGAVYLADDITLGRRVAIKFLSSTAAEYRGRFLREARAVSGLIHPNIATVFDYGETADATPYIVMEFIEGQTLSDRLHQGSLSLPEAVRIVSSIAAGLGEAHHHGVVHRDVKPSNVVLTTRGQVKIVDFGLVKEIQDDFAGENRADNPVIGTRTRSDVIVGTPLYLSPEQAKGKKVDGRSDLFALGAVLYECITGQSAFTGASVIEIGAQVLHVTPTLPSKLNPRVPAELDRITMKAIEKDMDARYQTAGALVNDLQAILPSLAADDSSLHVRTTGSIQATRTHSLSALTTISETIRRPRLSLATFVVAIVAVALLSWIILRWWKPNPYKPNAQAQDWYDKGTEGLRRGAFLQARKAFEQSVASDPNYPLAHARLAEALFELDYWDKAREEMLRALALVPNRAELARSDDLYLQAINATVTRNFPAAVGSYRELARLSPNDSQVHVDLGRAYEKNDDIKNALASHIEATQHPPQYAHAFLRVGIQYAELGDLASAMGNFDKAQGMFEAGGNFEGQAEVAFQRGALYDKRNEETAAEPHLKRALDLFRTTANQYGEVKALLKLGNVASYKQEPEKARQLINQALSIAQANGSDAQVKRGLVDLGNTYMLTTHFDEAEKYFRQSLKLAQEQKDTRNATRALLAIATALQRQARADEALTYIDQAIPFYKQNGYRKEYLQALALMARIKRQKGDFESARRVFEDQIKVAEDLGDKSQVQSTQQDIGLMLMSEGRQSEAFKRFDDSLAIARSLQEPKSIGLSLINRADALWQLGQYEEANKNLTEAGTIAEKLKAPNLHAGFFAFSARLALSRQDWDEAKKKALKTLELSGTKFKTLGTEAASTLCLANASSGNRLEARRHCDDARNRAEAAADPALMGETLLIVAQAQLAAGDNAEALKTALDAQERLSKLGKQECEWIASYVAAFASRALNNGMAQDYAKKAQSMLAGLEQRWGADYYKTYLSRPDIQSYQIRLKEFLAQN